MQPTNKSKIFDAIAVVGKPGSLNEAVDFSKKENLINEIKINGYLKYRDKPTISPYIMAKWTLDEMVENRILTKENTTEGNFFFRKKYVIYKLK